MISSHSWDEDDRPDHKYHVSLVEVDLQDSERLRESLQSCGWELVPKSKMVWERIFPSGYNIAVPYSGDLIEDPKIVVKMLIEAMHGYGAYAPLEQWDGNNRLALRKLAREESLRLDDPEAHEEAMSRSVNAIGSTAREYSRGDIVTAIKRGVADGNEAALVLDHAYRAAKGRTLSGKVLPEYDV
jgi:hypothetical protein